MTGIDRLISTSLSHVIKKKLNSDERKNIERKLFLEHGMSIKLSIEHFHKFDKALKNISSIDKKKFENECINEIIKIKKTDKNYSIKIIDQKLRESKVPKTSGYRKIENLIINGLILESGKILSESKKISKYRCVFDEIKIEMGKNDIMIQAMINEKIFDESTSINITN